MTQEILQKLQNGEINADQAYAQLKTMEKEIKEAISTIQPEVFDYLADFWKTELEQMGYRNTMRTTYTYSENEEWLSIDTKKKELEKRIKTATDSQSALVDPETWEIIAQPVTPKYSNSYSYIWVK